MVTESTRRSHATSGAFLVIARRGGEQFGYRSAHAASLRDRKAWFEPMDGPILALWWIPAGHIPTVAEAIERLRLLAERGPSPGAFTFRKPYPPPDAKEGQVPGLDAAFCEYAT